MGVPPNSAVVRVTFKVRGVPAVGVTVPYNCQQADAGVQAVSGALPAVRAKWNKRPLLNVLSQAASLLTGIEIVQLPEAPGAVKKS